MHLLKLREDHRVKICGEGRVEIHGHRGKAMVGLLPEQIELIRSVEHGITNQHLTGLSAGEVGLLVKLDELGLLVKVTETSSRTEIHGKELFLKKLETRDPQFESRTIHSSICISNTMAAVEQA